MHIDNCTRIAESAFTAFRHMTTTLHQNEI